MEINGKTLNERSLDGMTYYECEGQVLWVRPYEKLIHLVPRNLPDPEPEGGYVAELGPDGGWWAETEEEALTLLVENLADRRSSTPEPGKNYGRRETDPGGGKPDWQHEIPADDNSRAGSR